MCLPYTIFDAGMFLAISQLLPFYLDFKGLLGEVNKDVCPRKDNALKWLYGAYN